MTDQRTDAVAEPTAVRVALWRATHLQADPPPHVLDDAIGLRLAAPPDGWRDRPDMDAVATARARASIVARARFIEDLVAEQAGDGVGQYVVLGAGLDTFAGRRPQAAAGMRIFEVDQPGPQAWKRRRLVELGLGTPERLPFTSSFAPPQMLALARAAGFATARHVSAAELTRRYFAGRADGLRPSSSEELLVAST